MKNYILIYQLNAYLVSGRDEEEAIADLAYQFDDWADSGINDLVEVPPSHLHMAQQHASLYYSWLEGR
ncbi:hypothetical protein [Paraburkholderia sediminicola]|uniref:hypothetical protein n=1 Tax=Paraburkholderia sediminicola TaxID=458836 RepID=UPI0038BA88F2